MVLAAAVIATIFLITLGGNEAGTEERIVSSPEDGTFMADARHIRDKSKRTTLNVNRSEHDAQTALDFYCLCTVDHRQWFTWSVPDTFAEDMNLHAVTEKHTCSALPRHPKQTSTHLFSVSTASVHQVHLLFNTKRYHISCCMGDPRT